MHVRVHWSSGTHKIPSAPGPHIYLGVGDALAAVEKVEQNATENVLANLHGCPGLRCQWWPNKPTQKSHQAIATTFLRTKTPFS